ncbi:site-2 protease family protein [Novosphingobium sp. Gsoil 351]|uniref:site-2 protease family protein n=1 Tax=Novosphingobium sp. Gsoil 351 TaxID=2675225 RepID=UPI0012B4CDE2|nr:site-2 protease family protein [Novosphingobium sp. Gsoil 351]QGN55425.1 site-2 protease family protein [Novosphingobium sp. Gsoil 351]
MSDTIYQAAALILPLIVAIVFHEVAHGWVANALGDPTAKERRRLSLNPFRHVDPIGTVVLPGLLALVKAPVFGWAKPVPVIKQRLRNPRFGMMAVAAAGPGSNLLLAAIGAVVLGLLVRGVGDAQPAEPLRFIALNLGNFLTINIFLALFNLLPIPPFDGSHIVEGLLPPRAAATYDKLRPLGFPLVFVLLIGLPYLIPGFDLVSRIVLPPVQWLGNHYYALAQAVAGQ